jgi:hypothetical protein
MKKTDTHAFVNQLLVYTLVMICFTGSVGLGTVWLRHQISVTANRNKQLEARLAEMERHLGEAITAVEAEQGPDRLLERNDRWHLGLARPQEPQVQRVSEDVVLAMAKNRNRGLFTDVGVTSIVFHQGGSR